MRRARKLAVVISAVSALAMGGVCLPVYAAETDLETVRVQPNPWYANGPFQGWGTSLAWFANATGSYGEPGSITKSSGDAQSDKKALEYGAQLREEFYTSIFGEEGLDLNKARFNVGGGNASDVAYGYPFMRQGAAVPGYWAQDVDGSKHLYGNVTTKQDDKDDLEQAFNPDSDDSYVWGAKSRDDKNAAAVQAQEWWLKRGAKDGDITHLEVFANSAPWFMTESGYATGGSDASANNLKNPQMYAQYLAHVVQHLNQLKSNNGRKITVDTVEPFNESETSYWGTPAGRASGDWSSEQEALINRYWDRYFSIKSKAVTPYSQAIKKPQEGMHVDIDKAEETITALSQALKAEGMDSVKIAATDATDSGQFVDSYNQYSQDVRDAIGQYNTHSYGTNRQRVARDIAQGDGKTMSMSEVDGSWQGGGFNPYGFDNALGMAGKINSDVYALQSQDFTFWQVVEDLYNMSTGDRDVNGHVANPKGENTNWGTVLIDFDCSVAGRDGKLYSERAVDNNEGSTVGIKPCTVLVNSKYNAVRAYTKFIHEGDLIIANDATRDNMTARSSDGKTQTLIHRNESDSKQNLVIDLSQYGHISDHATGKLFLTTAPKTLSDSYGASMKYMNQYSNQEQEGAVHIDSLAKTATVEVPARSIASIQLTGVNGQSDQAGVTDGDSYQLVGQQSGRAVQTDASGSLSIQDPASDKQSGLAQTFVFHQAPALPQRPNLLRFVITDPAGQRILGAQGRFEQGQLEEAKMDPRFVWILNTEDGSRYSLVNSSAKLALEVTGQATAAGAPVGLYQSNGEANQAWSLRSNRPSGAKKVVAQVRKGGQLQLPTTVIPYYEWGTGTPIPVQWDTSGVDLNKQGTYVVTGEGEDIFGNRISCAALVYVGDFTVVDPVSITVLAGVSGQEVRDALVKAPVHAHVKASEPIEADRGSVQWDFTQLDEQLALGHAGDRIAVRGQMALDGGKTLQVNASVYLVKPKQKNVADTALNLTVTDQQTEYGKADQWRKLTDGDTSAEAWVTWNSAGDYSHSPTATLDFGQERELGSLTITYEDHAPVSVKAEYSTDGVNWQPFGKVVVPRPRQTVTFKNSDLVRAVKARIVNTVQGNFMNASEIQAWAIPKAEPIHNIAASAGTHFSVNVQEGSTGAKAIDGKYERGWSTWNEQGTPQAIFNFDQLQTVSQVKTTFFRDGRASWPKSQILEYQDAEGQWHRVGEQGGWYTQPGSGIDESTVADTPTSDFRLSEPVQAKALRLTNPLQDSGVYINVAEIEVYGTQTQVESEPEEGADGALGDLRLDGETIEGFAPCKKDYTVQLPLGAESNPVLQAFGRDTAAKVTIDHRAAVSVSDQANVAGGQDLITVKPADNSKALIYTVTYSSPSLKSLRITPPNRTTYQVGEKLNLEGMLVDAIYDKGDGLTQTVRIDLNDPQLSISGFDSNQAGRKMIKVTYRTVAASFELTVVNGGSAGLGTDSSGPRGDAESSQPIDGHDALSSTGSAVSSLGLAALLFLVFGSGILLLRSRR